MEDPTPENNEDFNFWLEDRKELFWRVLHYTHERFKCFEQMLDLDELVEEAFRDVFDDRRHPPADKSPAEGMFVVIGSKVSNWLTRERRSQPLEGIPESRVTKDPTDTVLIHFYLRELVKGDLILMEMVEIWIQDPDLKPRDFPMVMEISIDEVYSALKRLRRRIKKERNH